MRATERATRSGSSGSFHVGFPGLDVAETAAPRARVAEDHERRRAALPALADVRARRLLADRVKVLVADLAVELPVARATRWRHLEPRRLAAAERLHVAAERGVDVHPTRVRARARRVLTHPTQGIGLQVRRLRSIRPTRRDHECPRSAHTSCG